MSGRGFNCRSVRVLLGRFCRYWKYCKHDRNYQNVAGPCYGPGRSLSSVWFQSSVELSRPYDYRTWPCEHSMSYILQKLRGTWLTGRPMYTNIMQCVPWACIHTYRCTPRVRMRMPLISLYCPHVYICAQICIPSRLLVLAQWDGGRRCCLFVLPNHPGGSNVLSPCGASGDMFHNSADRPYFR